MSDLPAWAMEQGRSLCWGAGAEAIARALVAERAAERERCALHIERRSGSIPFRQEIARELRLGLPTP